MSGRAVAPARQATVAESGTKNELALQRKCSCGQHTVAGGECEACRRKRLRLQRWPADRAPAPGAPRLERGGTAPLATSERSILGVARPTVDATAAKAAAPEPGRAETTESSPATPSTAPALLTDDDVAEVASGQLRKSEFLDQLERAVSADADAALAGTGRSTAGCPYLAQSFAHYRARPAVYVEAALRRYAPEVRNARTAAEYIPAVVARVRQGVERWARTGEVSGVPAGLPFALPFGGGLPGAIGELASAAGGLFLKAREGGARDSADPVVVQRELGQGRPLETGVRGRMERAFGRSFAGVTLHTNATAHRLSSEQNARAFTVGTHVAFAAGEYRPGTMIGDALIAHELAHTLQQQAGSEAPLRSSARHDAGYGRLEADADRIATRAVIGLHGNDHAISDKPVIPARTGLRLQRCGGRSAARGPVSQPSGSSSPPPDASRASGPCTGQSLAATYTPTDQGVTASPGANEFGTTAKLAAQMSYGAFSDGQFWHFCLTSLTVRVASAVQPIDFRTNIEAANDPDVTQATYPAVMADLRPNRRATLSPVCGGNRFSDRVTTYSRRDTYWNQQLVIDHEAFHRRDWDATYRPELMQAEQSIWAHTLPAAAAGSEPAAIQHERSMLDGFMIGAYQSACRAYAPAQESRAYADGAPAYQRLVDDIEARATAQGWTTATSPTAP